MEYQNLGTQQRSKGANMKQALLAMLLVVGCSWLIYQINHSRHEPDNYGGLHRPVEQQYWAVSLGRKGTPSWLYEIQVPTLGKIHIAELENDQNSGDTDEKGQGNVENPKIAVINDSQSNEKEAEVQIRMNTEPDGSIKENEEVEESKTVTGGFWVHTFDDENGVPPEVNGENISNDRKENGVVKSNILDAISSSENDIVEETFGGSTSVVVDAEVNSRSIIAHADT